MTDNKKEYVADVAIATEFGKYVCKRVFDERFGKPVLLTQDQDDRFGLIGTMIHYCIKERKTIMHNGLG